MDLIQKRVYLEEIANAAEFSILMRNQFLKLVNNNDTKQSLTVWMSLQAALLQLGMVSKFLFPVRNQGVAFQRGSELRQELGVPDISPLKNRDARNALEHFDERLDRCLEIPNSGILQAVFETRYEYEYLKPSRWIIRRAYIIDEDIYVSEGTTVHSRVELPLTDIFDVVSDVYKTANHLLTTTYRLY